MVLFGLSLLGPLQIMALSKNLDHHLPTKISIFGLDPPFLGKIHIMNHIAINIISKLDPEFSPNLSVYPVIGEIPDVHASIPMG